MADIWNPNEKQKQDKHNYYLMSSDGKILQTIRNNFFQAVKEAQRLMDLRKIKVAIVLHRGE